jgi:hypothetical protein
MTDSAAVATTSSVPTPGTTTQSATVYEFTSPFFNWSYTLADTDNPSELDTWMLEFFNGIMNLNTTTNAGQINLNKVETTITTATTVTGTVRDLDTGMPVWDTTS